jgi:glutathionyl-hydroquinone reductase
MKDLLKNEEFEIIFQKVKNEVNDFIKSRDIEFGEGVSIDDIIMWHRPQSGDYLVYPSEKCPKEIKNIIISIIKKNNPTLN